MNKTNISLLKISIFGICLFALNGCATMNESDCVAADWYQIGYKDGTRGMTTSMLDSRASACTKFGVSLDRSSYMTGRDNGLVEFCTPDQGYTKAQAKEEYNYVCPANLQTPFLKEYVKGLNEVLDTLDYDIRDLDADIREAELDAREASTPEKKETANKRVTSMTYSRDRIREETRQIRGWLNRAIDAL